MMQTVDPKNEEKKKQFSDPKKFQQFNSQFCPCFLKEKKHLKNLCKSLQTLNLMLKMCCHINVRSNQTVHATSEDQRIKMSGQQRWLQKIAFSGHLLLVGVTHEQGEKLNHNIEFLLTVQKGGRCAGFSRGMLFLDTDKWSYSKKEKKMQCFLKNCLLTPKKVQESIVTKRTSSRAKLPKLQSPLCHLIAVQLWECSFSVSQYPHLQSGDSYSTAFIGCCEM